ncbi:MAG: acyl carrier protein [Mollicutes bacterium]|nr:acyl carrier protein [Mollicutes bacterium]
MKEIFEQVKTTVAEQLSIDENIIANESSFIDDLGADSLDIAELIIALEEAFDIKISDEEALKIVNVKNAVDYIMKAKNISDEEKK